MKRFSIVFGVLFVVLVMFNVYVDLNIVVLVVMMFSDGFDCMMWDIMFEVVLIEVNVSYYWVN